MIVWSHFPQPKMPGSSLSMISKAPPRAHHATSALKSSCLTKRITVPLGLEISKLGRFSTVLGQREAITSMSTFSDVYEQGRFYFFRVVGTCHIHLSHLGRFSIFS